jgi:hypothetical protein
MEREIAKEGEKKYEKTEEEGEKEMESGKRGRGKRKIGKEGERDMEGERFEERGK